MILRLEDEHARVVVASDVADGEFAEAALTVVKTGVARRGVPQRLRGGAEHFPLRWEAQPASYASSLGTEAITGRPYNPTAQSNNDRFHQTFFRYLDKQPIAKNIAELQAQVEELDIVYNTERRYQESVLGLTSHR